VGETTGSTPTERRGYNDEGRPANEIRGYNEPRFNIAPTQGVLRGQGRSIIWLDRLIGVPIL